MGGSSVFPSAGRVPRSAALAGRRCKMVFKGFLKNPFECFKNNSGFVKCLLKIPKGFLKGIHELFLKNCDFEKSKN